MFDVLLFVVVCLCYCAIAVVEAIRIFEVSASPFKRACVFLKWSKMAIIPFCTFLPVLKKTVTQRNQEQIRSPKPSLDHGRRIKTILGQFRNKHARVLDADKNTCCGKREGFENAELLS